MRVALSTPRLLLAALALHLALPSASVAAEPPNRDDPCSSAGRNTCGTLGVGFYSENRYGIRWFGDYRGAAAGKTPTFCLDTRFWYASPIYEYRRASGGVLRNRDGEMVPVDRRQKIAYAIWRYGRSMRPDQQAAVALYVHALMGDSRPGEADPAALNARVVALYRTIARNASRYHGPYRIETHISRAPTVGTPVDATIRVLSATGIAVPNLRLKVSAEGTIVAPAGTRTDREGNAVVAVTPTAAGQSLLRVETAPLAAALPRIFHATAPGAAGNAQRLAAPASVQVTGATPVTTRAAPAIATVVSTQVANRGARIFDRIRVQGLGQTRATIEVELFGPFATRSAINCEQQPYWTSTVVAEGDGEIRSPTVKLAKAGFYAFRERLIGSAFVADFTTDCPLADETALVAPKIIAGRARARAASYTAAPDARGSRPVRVQLPSVGIDAVVLPVGIDVRHGVLGTPSGIRRAGWWKDGSRPGATTGAILIAGHVDSAHDGAGAFYSLHRARNGDAVGIRTASGRTFMYRITAVRSYHKTFLPTSIYSGTGPRRLVLVTCGGPFNQTTGHYRDNIVVTAVPA